MMFLSLLMLSFLIAFWFKRELKQFPTKIQQQVYQDMISLIPLTFTLDELLKRSHLKTKKKDFSNLFFVLFPIGFCFYQHYSLFIISIIVILIYLSFVDFLYYLTDIHYVALIFLFSVCDLVFFKPFLLELHLINFIFTAIFFVLFSVFSQWLFKKTALGSGDVVLFIALSPLFVLEQMLFLLLFASLFGLAFSGIYWLITKQKLSKLPFIPFISLACLIQLA